MANSIQEAMPKAVEISEPSSINLDKKPTLIELLSPEHVTALMVKWETLPKEGREKYELMFPGVSNTAELYILRSAYREAIAQQASQLRPGYIISIMSRTRSLVSGVPDTKNEAVKFIKNLVEDIPDSSERKKIAKAVKVKMDMDSKNPAIIALCELLGISTDSVK
jgi:hypothetical protein